MKRTTTKWNENTHKRNPNAHNQTNKGGRARWCWKEGGVEPGRRDMGGDEPGNKGNGAAGSQVVMEVGRQGAR